MGTGARTSVSTPVSPPERLPAHLPPRRLCCPLLWEVNGNDPSPDDTSRPPTLITVTAKHFVSIIWQAASRLPVAPEHPQSRPGPGQTPSAPALRLPAAEPAPDASRRGGFCRALQDCTAGRAGPGHSRHWDTGRQARGHMLRGGQGTPSSQHPGARLHPRELLRGQQGVCRRQHPQAQPQQFALRRRVLGLGARTSAGAEPVAMCAPVPVRVSVHVRLCVSVCLCTCARVCLCAQPRKVTVRERCQQPRNGLGMESVSQVEPQGWPEPSHSSPSVVTVSICAAAMGGVGPAVPGHPQVPLPGDSGRAGGQRAPGGAVRARGAWLWGGKGKGRKQPAEGKSSAFVRALCPVHWWHNVPIRPPPPVLFTASLCSLAGLWRPAPFSRRGCRPSR